MKYYKVTFKHTKHCTGGYKYSTMDWTFAEGDNAEEAKQDAVQWVKENRCSKHCMNRIRVLDIMEIK